MDRARSGDREAFRVLVELHQDRIFRYVVRQMRCDRHTGADLAQEVFLRAWRGLRAFDGRCSFSTWLHKIALNVGISDVRRRRAVKRRKRTLSIDQPLAGADDLRIDPPAPEPTPDDLAHQQEFAAAVRAALQDVPEDFRQAVILRDLQGLSYEEISEILGIPAGTVRSRIHRGRLILQQRLEGFR